jgi:hypothetical protein
MNLNIHEKDITSAVCGLCAACCRLKLELPTTDTRYRQFLRKTGFSILPAAEPGRNDCCDKQHGVTVDFGDCPHLGVETQDGKSIRRCRVYGSADFPQLCAQFNCVSWAKTKNRYSTRNELLVKAQLAKDLLSARGGDSPE